MQRHRRRHLHNQRGASVIEGLVVIVMLAVLLAFGVHFHRKYTGALTIATDARAATWISAIGGCSRNLELQDEVAELLKGTLPTNPRAAMAGRNPLTVVGDPGLIVRGSGPGAAVVAPCSELAQVNSAQVNQLEESLVRRLLGSL